jgi:ubiquinone biosynthesis protein
MTQATAAPAPAMFEELQIGRPPGLISRLFTTWRHFAGLGAGGLAAWVRAKKADGTGRGPGFLLARIINPYTSRLVDRELRAQSFPVQLRRRCERLGPTYIKLGQILSLREDILPRSVTDELKNLLSRLPAAPFDAVLAIIEQDLQRPAFEAFLDIEPIPLGSASIGQTHRATTHDGDEVVIKVVKPGIREILQRDAKLLKAFGWLLQIVAPRYQPKNLINEFVMYTLREVDLTREADNAETFAANFKDLDDIVFPAIHRDLSGPSVLTMAFLKGVQPDSEEAQALPAATRERLVDMGAASIIRMLYKDGFFHADLHPGNLLVLEEGRIGFIDLGMVGRLDDELRRTMLYYFFSLVTGDAESAARYLAASAQIGHGSDPVGFRREVAEMSRRWKRAATFEDYSLGQLILESVQRGAQYRLYFPVELVLMVKALVTFEGVGHVLLPGFDVAEVSKKHVRRIFIQQFSPVRLFQEGVRGAPDVMDALVKLPLLMTEGLRVLEKTAKRSSENPLAGIRGSLIAGFCLVSGAIVLATHGPWPIWGVLFVLALFLAVRRGS